LIKIDCTAKTHHVDIFGDMPRFIAPPAVWKPSPVKQPKRDECCREDFPVILSAAQTWELKQVIKHVEYYQPLYGLQIDPKPLRSCRDRAEAIAGAIGPLSPGMRLVDFGCSLGYFVFYFADRGIHAQGIDLSASNVAVAQTVRRINRLSCSLSCAQLTLEYVRTIPVGRYNVGLLLSILHHIIHREGLEYARELVGELSRRIPVLVLEMAHREEQVSCDWRNSLPEDPLEVLSSCQNVHLQKLGEFETHLSPVPRPLWLLASGDIRPTLQLPPRPELTFPPLKPTHRIANRID
jgi:SAM-dependent methyltransferase